jgi:hypothetical protein
MLDELSQTIELTLLCGLIEFRFIDQQIAIRIPLLYQVNPFVKRSLDAVRLCFDSHKNRMQKGRPRAIWFSGEAHRR